MMKHITKKQIEQIKKYCEKEHLKITDWIAIDWHYPSCYSAVEIHTMSDAHVSIWKSEEDNRFYVTGVVVEFNLTLSQCLRIAKRELR